MADLNEVIGQIATLQEGSQEDLQALAVRRVNSESALREGIEKAVYGYFSLVNLIVEQVREAEKQGYERISSNQRYYGGEPDMDLSIIKPTFRSERLVTKMVYYRSGGWPYTLIITTPVDSEHTKKTRFILSHTYDGRTTESSKLTPKKLVGRIIEAKITESETGLWLPETKLPEAFTTILPALFVQATSNLYAAIADKNQRYAKTVTEIQGLESLDYQDVVKELEGIKPGNI